MAEWRCVQEHDAYTFEKLPFEEFRKESMNNFSMDPCHFISLPGFAYNAFLKQTDVNLEYITDPEMFQMLSSNLRGGHSFCSQRCEESPPELQMRV